MPKPKKPIPKNPSGEPDEMKEIGEAISGEQPEIGDKDTGVGSNRRLPPDESAPAVPVVPNE